MRYEIRQKVFSIGDGFKIRDERGRDAFTVRQELLSLGKKLIIQNSEGREVCLIQQRLMKLLPEYDIFSGGEFVAKVKKKFSLVRNDFLIEAKENDLEAEGNFFGFDFAIFKSGSEVGRISKKFFALTDTYGVEVENEEDATTVLALAIVIDMVCHPDAQN